MFHQSINGRQFKQVVSAHRAATACTPPSQGASRRLTVRRVFKIPVR